MMTAKRMMMPAALAVCAALSAPTWAQPAQGPRTEETRRSLHLAGRNVLGILQYCQAQGFIGPDAAEAQRDLLRRAPPATVPGLDEAEAAGRQGIVAFLDSRVTIQEAAQAEGVLVETRCRLMALGLGAS